jgi:acetolactate synthase-1/2/3 large subunit
MDHLTALVLREPGPIVCIVKCPEWHSYYPKISGWHTPIEDMEPLLNNKEFMENMLIRPSDATIKARGL